jgi:hypothetical protein
MAKVETLSLEEQYKDALVSFSPFVLRSTGIIQSQTTLKVDTYTLVCVPYQLTMSKVILIGAFTKDEIAFFQRFTGSLAGLVISVQRPTTKEPEKIFCRCQISAIGQMKGRDGVGLIVCAFKPIPPALAELLGEHLLGLDRLKVQWEDYRRSPVQVNPESSRLLGYNNYAVMTAGGEQHKLALYSIAVDRVDFLMPMRSPDMALGAQVNFSLYFQKYRFGVAGAIESAERLPTGVQRVRASISFSPELCDIFSDYYLAARSAARKA